MRRMKSRAILVCVIVAVACIAMPARAQEDRIRALERRVEQLEKRLSSEKVSPAKAVERGGAAADWRSKANWRRLKVGMTEDDVRSILGEPQKVDVGTALVFWNWNYPGGPSVHFIKSNRLVDGWSEP